MGGSRKSVGISLPHCCVMNSSHLGVLDAFAGTRILLALWESNQRTAEPC
jgi:hypothetical protein